MSGTRGRCVSVGEHRDASASGKLAVCIGCGCDDLRACWDDAAGQPCSWLRVDRAAGKGVCSVCKDQVPAWDRAHG